MGGRGATSPGGGGGGGGGLNVTNKDSLVSSRNQGYRTEADETLSVLRDIERTYGIQVEEAQIATIKGRGAYSCMAYYDSRGNLAVNKFFFNADKMNQAYDESVKSGFHPKRGDKTGMQAVVAHEMGHRLTDVAAQNAGYGSWQLDKVSGEIVTQAAKNLGQKPSVTWKKISGYGQTNRAEAVAEAFADVYCNGNKAKRESRAITFVLNSYLNIK